MTDVTIDNPYRAGSDYVWLKGNFHTHTTRSDGMQSPQETVDAYAALGYDFLGLSDHDTTPDLDGLNARGMILVPVSEVSGASAHVLALGVTGTVPAWQAQQATLDAIRKADGLSVLCHPDWGDQYDHYTIGQMLNLQNYAGIEIYNGGVEDEAGNACTADKWDRVLSEDRRVWGLASDDAHVPMGQGRGWCVAQASDRSLAALLDAMRRGSFYASTGVSIERIEQDGTRLRIHASNADGIAAIGACSRRLAWAERSVLEFDVDACTSPYVRFECFGRAGRKAWTQPFGLGGESMNRLRALRAERPALQVLRVNRAPVFSGRMDDPLWRETTAVTRFVRVYDAAVMPVRTELRALTDGRELFFGVRCEEPNADNIRVGVQRHGSANLWTNDGIELFMDVDNGKERYFHAIVNADGFVWMGERGCGEDRPRRVPEIRTASFRGPSEYGLEIAMDLKGFDLSAKPGTTWGFNCVRNRRAGVEPDTFAWSFTGGNNHCPRRFGELRF